jgi:hypothetical protein
MEHRQATKACSKKVRTLFFVRFCSELDELCFREAVKHVGSTVVDFLDKLDRQMGVKAVVLMSWVNDKEKLDWMS